MVTPEHPPILYAPSCGGVEAGYRYKFHYVMPACSCGWEGSVVDNWRRAVEQWEAHRGAAG